MKDITIPLVRFHQILASPEFVTAISGIPDFFINNTGFYDTSLNVTTSVADQSAIVTSTNTTSVDVPRGGSIDKLMQRP